jgi:hypothetical protein
MSKANPRFRRVNPPLPVASGYVVNVQPYGHGEAGIWLMNIGYQAAVTSVPNGAEAAIALSWISVCAVALRACMVPTYSLDGVKVTCVSNLLRNPQTNSSSVSLGAGTFSGTALPSTVAGVISKRTVWKGQHGRGRNYLPGVPQGFVTPATDPDRINSTGIASYNSFITDLQSGSVTDGTNLMTPCVYTRVPKGGNVTQAANVISWLMQPLLGTVRRRRVGRGK